jgi:hypothetical protein
MVTASLGRVRSLCERAELRGCKRLSELLDSAGRVPEDLLLQAIAGVLEEIEEEAGNAMLEELAEAAREARRDVEWALRESGW